MPERNPKRTAFPLVMHYVRSKRQGFKANGIGKPRKYDISDDSVKSRHFIFYTPY